MNKTYLYNLIVEEQLSRLTVSLSEQEYEILENIIISDGCQKIIETWNHIILDGFAEYAVCRQQQIPYYKKEVSLASYEEAVLYAKRHFHKKMCQKNNIGIVLGEFMMPIRFFGHVFVKIRFKVCLVITEVIRHLRNFLVRCCK